MPPGPRQVRPGHEDGLLRAERERPAGRYCLSEDAAEITCRSRLEHENQDVHFVLCSRRWETNSRFFSVPTQIPFIGPDPIVGHSPQLLRDRPDCECPGTSAYGRYCCKSRKSNNPKNLAKVDFGLLCGCVAL